MILYSLVIAGACYAIFDSEQKLKEAVDYYLVSDIGATLTSFVWTYEVFELNSLEGCEVKFAYIPKEFSYEYSVYPAKYYNTNLVNNDEVSVDIIDD